MATVLAVLMTAAMFFIITLVLGIAQLALREGGLFRLSWHPGRPPFHKGYRRS